MKSPMNQVDESPEGITLLGREMLTWSDLESGMAPASSGVAGELVAPVEGVERALVLGPHRTELIAGLAASAGAVDVLVRSMADAEALRAELPASVQIHCGAFGAFVQQGYDLVVALDGLDRIQAAEETPLPWRDLAQRVLGLVAPTGVLWLVVPNPAGLDRVLGGDLVDRDGDAHWPAGTVQPSGAGTGGLEDVVATLDARAPGRGCEPWAVYGERAEPAFVAPAALLATLRGDDRLSAYLEDAARLATVRTPVFRDAGSVANLLLRQGLAAALAPRWLFRIGPGGTDPQPAELWTEDGRIVAGAGAWTTGSGVVPPGERASEALARAVHDQDPVAWGELVRGYRSWLLDGSTTSEDGSVDVASDRVAVTLDRLLVTDTGWALRRPDAPAQVADRAPVDDVLVRSLQVFLRRLEAAGGRLPHPDDGPRYAVAALAASAGVEHEDIDWDRIAELDARLADEPDPVAVPTPAEALAVIERQRAALVEAEAQLDWLVRNIHVRQRRLLRVKNKVREIRSSPEYLTGRKVLAVKARWSDWREDRRQRRNGAVGEWQEGNDERVAIDVDPKLLPPGYEPKGPTV